MIIVLLGITISLYNILAYRKERQKISLWSALVCGVMTLMKALSLLWLSLMFSIDYSKLMW
jgi:hypothetical protein